MTGGHPIASDLITNPKACDLITKTKPSVAVGSPGTSDSHRDPGSAGTSTETNRNHNTESTNDCCHYKTCIYTLDVCL